MAVSNIIQPNGDIWLCKGVPLTPSYIHSIYFSSSTEQNTYFSNRVLTKDGISIGHLTNQNYVKSENGKIRVSRADLDNNAVMDANYMMYQNATIKHGSDPVEVPERVFAFITDISLVSPNVFEITYELDVLQTYALFHADFKQCLIERRNVNRENDVIGEHIEPEPVKIGNYIYQNKEEQDQFNPDITQWHILVFCPYNIINADSLPETPEVGGIGAGTFQGCFVNVFRDYPAFTERMAGIASSDADKYTKIVNSIVSVIAVPAEFSEIYNGGVDQGKRGKLAPNSTHRGHYNFHTFLTSGKLGITQYDQSDNPTNGYTPHNKKLYTYPYNMLHVTNADGKSTDFRYEFFQPVTDSQQTGTLRFEILVSVQPNFEIVLVPYNYDGVRFLNFELSIPLADIPQVPWFTDAYAQWLGSSKIGYGLGLLGAGASAVRGVVSDNPLALAGSPLHATNVLGQWMASSHNAAIAPMPYHQGGTSAKEIVGANTFYGFQKCVNEEDARLIDEFFTYFGYGVNHIGAVNFKNTKWYHHYIKTIGCMVSGKCPAIYARQIEDVFNKGITWWDASNSTGSIANIGVYRDANNHLVEKPQQ